MTAGTTGKASRSRQGFAACDSLPAAANFVGDGANIVEFELFQHRQPVVAHRGLRKVGKRSCECLCAGKRFTIVDETIDQADR
jgi:hypothetical protein